MDEFNSLSRRDRVIFTILGFHENYPRSTFDKIFNYLLDVFKTSCGEHKGSLDFPIDDMFQKYKLIKLFTKQIDNEGFNLENGMEFGEEETKVVSYSLEAFLSVYHWKKLQVPIDDFFSKFALHEEEKKVEEVDQLMKYFLGGENQNKSSSFEYLKEISRQECFGKDGITDEDYYRYNRTHQKELRSKLEEISKGINSGVIKLDYDGIVNMCGLSMDQNKHILRDPSKMSRMPSFQKLEIKTTLEVVTFFQRLLKSRRFVKPNFEKMFLTKENITNSSKTEILVNDKSYLFNLLVRENLNEHWKSCSQIGSFSNCGFMNFVSKFRRNSQIEVQQTIVTSFSQERCEKIMEEILKLMKENDTGMDIELKESGDIVRRMSSDNKNLKMIELFRRKRNFICSIRLSCSDGFGKGIDPHKLCDRILSKAIQKIRRFLKTHKLDTEVSEEAALMEFSPSFKKYKFWMKRCWVCAKWGEGCKTMKCSACGVAYYCSRNCQKKDWKEHKKKCSLLKLGSFVKKK